MTISKRQRKLGVGAPITFNNMPPLMQAVFGQAAKVSAITTWNSIPVPDTLSGCSGIPTVQAHRDNEGAAGGPIKYVVHILPAKSLISIFSDVLLEYIRTMYNDATLSASQIEQGILSQFNTPYDMLLGIGYELKRTDSAIKYVSKLRDSENCWLLVQRFFGQELSPQ